MMQNFVQLTQRGSGTSVLIAVNTVFRMDSIKPGKTRVYFNVGGPNVVTSSYDMIDVNETADVILSKIKKLGGGGVSA